MAGHQGLAGRDKVSAARKPYSGIAIINGLAKFSMLSAMTAPRCKLVLRPITAELTNATVVNCHACMPTSTSLLSYVSRHPHRTCLYRAQLYGFSLL